MFNFINDAIDTTNNALSLYNNIDSTFGGDKGLRDRQQAAHDTARDSLTFQQNLATHGVRWRVEDVKAAMIHPAVALGMQPGSASGASLGFAEVPAQEWLGKSGHSIQRAAQATSTSEERAYNKALATLSLERAGLQNDLLRSQIARLQADQVGPPMVDPANPGVRQFGTSDVPSVTERPLERTAGARGASHQEPGSITELGFARTPTGFAPVPSKDVKERIEDNLVPEMMWAYRNNLLPNVGAGYPPPETWLPKGAVSWRWSHAKQEWQPEYRSRREIERHYPRQGGRGPSLWTGAP